MEIPILAIHLVLICILRSWIYMVKIFKHHTGVRKKEGISSLLVTSGLIITLLLTLAYILFTPIFRPLQLQPVFGLQVLALVMLVLHTLLLVITQIQLGKFWSGYLELCDQHKLITTGAYAICRHPMYLSVFLWILGIILLSQNLVFLITLLLPLGISLRIKKEEKLLEEYFGQDYRNYRAKTRMFL